MNHRETGLALLGLSGWLLLSSLLLAGASYWHWYVAARDQIAARLPALVADSLVNSHDPQQTLQHDLSRLNVEPIRLEPMVADGLIAGATLHWDELAPGPATTTLLGPLHVWQQDGHWLHARWRLDLRWHWTRLCWQGALLGSLLWLLTLVLPAPHRLHRRAWRLRLQQHGITTSTGDWLHRLHQSPELLIDAEHLSQQAQRPVDQTLVLLARDEVRQLDDTQRRWLTVALQQGLTDEAALAVARHPATLVFDLAASQVNIHGLPIRLSRTPLLYYYWYAQRCQLGLPPYVNPASQRPDHKEGEALAALMRQHAGHGKAISDLLAQGLKSKTLDQNRNKIRDELQQVLGDLAQPYLFDSTRDPATARYGYALCVAPEQIVL